MSTRLSSQNLYVIGNGFDLHHRIPSSYSAFGRHVRTVDQEIHRLFECYFSFEGNWADLENTLAHLDVDLIIDEASSYLASYSDEDWSDSYHHDYQYEVDRIVSALSKGLKARFTEWVFGLTIPTQSSCEVPLVGIDLCAKYLTFNYTNTLQKLYGIPPDKIVHIHNQAAGLDSDLVLGHGVSPSSIVSLNAGADMEAQDVRVTEANESIDEYFSRTYKPTNRIISEHQAFFDSLSSIKSIYVLGHSLSEVDLPYFSLIAKSTAVSAPNWIVSYYDETSIPLMTQTLEKIDIPSTKVKFICLSDM